MRSQLAMTPAVFAAPGDAILLLDTPSQKLKSQFLIEAETRNLEIIDLQNIKKIQGEYQIIPWGWNPPLANTLLKAGIPARCIPQPAALLNLRNLSHRRTAAKFILAIKDILPSIIVNPKECFSTQDAEEFLTKHNAAVFKAPWSSSGHGVIMGTTRNREILIPWIRGIIRTQASVMAEKMYQKNLEFASEWIIENQNPKFLGFSLFKTSGRGKYHGNNLSPQKDIIDKIIKTSNGHHNPETLNRIIARQQQELKNLIAPKYSGPLGIDMMIIDSGEIHPCIEINLRFTMGHVAIAKTLSYDKEQQP